MRENDEQFRRVRFYGANDSAGNWHGQRLVELVGRFDAERPPDSVMDILELHNVQQYLENRLLPDWCTEQEREQLVEKAPQIRGAIARFFISVDNSNFASIVTGVDYEFHATLLDLLGRHKTFARSDSTTVLSALKAAGLNLREMLANKYLVSAYDSEMRDEMLASSRSAQFLVQKYLQKGAQEVVHLPRSFTSTDSRTLLERYIDSDEANLNYVRLIATANDHVQAGIDAKLKLRAKRRSDELNAKIFDKNAGIKFGFELDRDCCRFG